MSDIVMPLRLHVRNIMRLRKEQRACTDPAHAGLCDDPTAFRQWTEYHLPMICAACGIDLPDRGQIDHKVPLHPREGEPAGAHCVDNVQRLCRACNQRKGNR